MSNSIEHTQNQVFRLIMEEWIQQVPGIEAHILNLETSLERDLGMTGDDAVEFIEIFFERFNVEPRNFSYSNHFYPEGLALPNIKLAMKYWRYLLTGKGNPHEETAEVFEIRVRHLVEAAVNGKWVY